MNLTSKSIKWMLKKYEGQPIPKYLVKYIIEAYKAGYREKAKCVRSRDKE